MVKHRTGPRDAEIGQLLRALRLQRGVSQAALGRALGVTFQQVQQYERGRNRISVGALCRIAEALNVPVTYFYSDEAGRQNELNSQSVAVGVDFLQTADAMRFFRAYKRIADSGVRLKLLKLAECLVESGICDR